MNRSNLWRSAIALALGAGLLAAAAAQAAPAEERPGAGDTRAAPGADSRPAPVSPYDDKRPLLRQPEDRSTRPNAGDARDARPPRDATARRDEPRPGPVPGAAAGDGIKP